jgi:hypothetical protein
MAGWTTPFDDPIPVPRGRSIETLEQAARYVQKLPTAEQDAAEWQAATEALILAAEGRGPVMHAHIGMLRALRRNEPVVFTDRKPQSWSKRRLLRDQ